MKLLVLGGTRFLGRHVVDAALEHELMAGSERALAAAHAAALAR